MHTDPIKIDITTDGSGNATVYTIPAFGYVDRVVVVLGTSTSIDVTLTFTDEVGSVTVYAATGIAASTRSRPSSNWHLDGQKMKIVAANGGATKTATVYVHFSDSPLSEITIAGDLQLGAVEVKDDDSDDRMVVKAANTVAVADKAAAVADANVLASLRGTGLPIPLALSDPGSDNYSAALSPNPIARACTRLRVLVGNSGCVLSFDGGATDGYKLPPNLADEIAIAIPASTDVRVKRYTAGTAITGLIVEVR